MSSKKTALYEEHIALGARMVDFNGWSMPVSYGKVIEEHKHVRTHAGIFDVSHMGEIFIKGTEAKYFLQKMLINDLEAISPGKGQYTALLNEQGGMIDDLIAYQLEENSYFLCVNAGNVAKDYQWLLDHSKAYTNLKLENSSDKLSQIAVQGPESFECLRPFEAFQSSKALADLDYGEIATLVDESGRTLYIARTGYTGEKGYELYLPNESAVAIWQKLLVKAKPIGLGARDTLRLEACYPLYGQEMDDEVNPLEIGIGWATKIAKEPSFIGRDVVAQAKELGLKRRLYAFHMTDPGIARNSMNVYQNGQMIGKVTSGSVLPSLDQRGGLSLLEVEKLDKKASIEIDIRGQKKKAKIVKKPMYKANTK